MEKRLGHARLERALPMRELIDAGLIVSGGSDWPGAPNNPFVNIDFYVTRKAMNGRVVGAGQKISRVEALRVMTLNNAWLTFEEQLKGSIEAGKLADCVVLSNDLLTVPEDRILSITAAGHLRRRSKGVFGRPLLTPRTVDPSGILRTSELVVRWSESISSELAYDFEAGSRMLKNASCFSDLPSSIFHPGRHFSAAW